VARGVIAPRSPLAHVQGSPMPQTATDAVLLVDTYTRFASARAAKWSRSYPSLSMEFASLAGEILWRVALAFDPEAGLPFAAVLGGELRVGFLHLLRGERSVSRRCFRQFTSVVRDDRGRTLDPLLSVPDSSPSPSDVLLQAEELATLPQLLDILPDDRREQLIRHVGHGETLATIAAETGTTRSNVGQCVARDLERLRAAAGATGVVT